MSKLQLFFNSIISEFYSPDRDAKNMPINCHVNLKDEMISTILAVEKALVMGLLQCLSALLFTLLILPIRCILSPSMSCALRTGALIGVSVLLSYYLSVSRLYHDLKEQDFLKLNAVYNMIGISDQLLISNSTENFIIVMGYVCLHTLHQSLALTVFEVALNSSTSNLTLIVVTAAFVEIKITVFKKNDKKTLMNVLCNDIIERLQLIIYLSTILCKALITSRGNIEGICKGISIVLLCSIFIDWIKHYYVMHYNGLSPILYTEIFTSMKNNWEKAYSTGRFNDGEEEINCDLDPACSLALSYKFTALPQACMVISIQLLRVFAAVLYYNFKPIVNAAIVAGLLIVKALIHLFIILF